MTIATDDVRTAQPFPVERAEEEAEKRANAARQRFIDGRDTAPPPPAGPPVVYYQEPAPTGNAAWVAEQERLDAADDQARQQAARNLLAELSSSISPDLLLARQAAQSRVNDARRMLTLAQSDLGQAGTLRAAERREYQDAIDDATAALQQAERAHQAAHERVQATLRAGYQQRVRSLEAEQKRDEQQTAMATAALRRRVDTHLAEYQQREEERMTRVRRLHALGVDLGLI